MSTTAASVDHSSHTPVSPVPGDDQRHSNAQSDGGDSLGTEYPPQKHAGKAGLGPHYYEQHRATFQDKVHGLREEVKGEIKHDKKLQQQGHERITGELKEKQRKEEEEKTAFHKSENEDQKTTDKPAATLEHKDEGQVPKEHKNKEYENKA